MTDRAVGIGCVVAHLSWAVALMLIAASWLIGNQPDGRLGQLGLAACLVAVTATVRVYFVKQNRIIRNAFALLGEQQDRERREGPVRLVP